MKKCLVLFVIIFCAFQSKANIEYKLRYNAVTDSFYVSFVSDVDVRTYIPFLMTYVANVGPSGCTLIFDQSYATEPIGMPATTGINGGAWYPQDKVPGNTGTLNNYKVIDFETTGAPIANGAFAGVEYPLFRFTFGAGLNCSGVLRLYVNGTDPMDPNGAGGDFTSYMDFGGTDDEISTNNDPTFQTCTTLGVLPVKFLAFTAVKSGDNAMLNWQVGNEDASTKNYVVERSLDKNSFQPIATVAANNNGLSSNSYDLKDPNLSALKVPSGIIYYRIRQVDVDGRYVYSAIQSVRISANAFYTYIYPNPVRSSLNISADIPQSGDVFMTITDAEGKLVNKTQFKGVTGINLQRINLANLASGSYILNIRTGDQNQSIPFIKTL